MKNSYYILYFLLILFSLSFIKGNAQQTNEDTYIINQYFQLNLEALLLLENETLPSTNAQSLDNFVLLNQVGNNNIIDIKNSINDSQTVNQIGDNNYYQFINYYSNSPSNFNILQQGESNSLQIYGENSIIKNISIIQKSNFKTLIIKNY